MTDTLGQRIIRLRTERGMSQGDLADTLDISRQSVSKWENDISTPELDKLIRLAELFDLSMDALILGKDEPTPTPPQNEPNPQIVPPPSASVSLGYQKTPISQTQKFVGLMLIGISSLFALICLTFFAWGGLLTALVLSSPLWGCGILCLIIRKRLGLSCCWLIFLLVSGYFYYATGTSQGAVFNRQFWIYGNIFSQITAVIETVLLALLYLWTFLSFRSIRMPKRLHLSIKQQVFAYIGCIVGCILYYALLTVVLPKFFLSKMDFYEWRVLYQLVTFMIYVGKLAWYTVLLLGARMLYNEHKAAKQKTE